MAVKLYLNKKTGNQIQVDIQYVPDEIKEFLQEVTLDENDKPEILRTKKPKTDA